jgi:hypothetical protein
MVGEACAKRPHFPRWFNADATTTKRFFFEKKNQKTFINSSERLRRRPRPIDGLQSHKTLLIGEMRL